MSDASQYLRHAAEVMRLADESKTKEEKQTLIEIACMWLQAAYASERAAARSYMHGFVFGFTLVYALAN
jgi:hypothetical protein